MRKLVLVLAGIVGSLSGCSEFVTTAERTTSVDVVGDPTDPTPDSMKRADILGSAQPMPDDIDSLVDITEGRGTPKALPDDIANPTDGNDEPDVVGEQTNVKPVSLKTNKSNTNSDE